ncbi:MAG: hypothetical protein ACPGSB_05695, partial [Opitutales bacterium]
MSESINRLRYSITLLLVLVTQSALAAEVTEGPDADGLDTEPGLRLRIFHIGHGFDTSLPLRPGQSPNIDLTVEKVQVEAGSAFRDMQKISGGPSERVREYYIAEWSGWVEAPVTGEYHFFVGSKAPTKLKVADKLVEESIQLNAGWHPIHLQQKVTDGSTQSISLTWKKPGDPNRKAYDLLEKEYLRAPKFYYRPTQTGLKQVTSGEARPGLGMKLDSLHPGYRLTNIRPVGMDMPVGGLGMLPDGRLAVARFNAQTLRYPDPTEDPNGELWLITNPTSEDPTEIKGEKIADGLFEPSGLAVLDNDIYVSQRNELSKFSFDPMSGKWVKQIVASGWKTNDFHQISAGLPWEPGPSAEHPGFFYMSRGAGLGKDRNPPNHASVWKIDLSKPNGKNIDVLTGGHRTPNGLGLNAAGECFVIDNQGHWTPANEINHVQKGKFYGFFARDQPPTAHPSPFQPKEQDGQKGVTPPAIQLPQDEIANSPTELLLFPEGHEFEGQMVVGDMRYGGLNRVFLEEVEGVWQGCVMR